MEEPEPIRLESAVEIQRASAAGGALQGAATTPAEHESHPAAPAEEPDVQLARPMQRPPTAQLCILDDGKQEGEWVRLRADRTTIGRVEGEIVIPHDKQMSARHAEIVREKTAKGWRWLLIDQ